MEVLSDNSVVVDIERGGDKDRVSVEEPSLVTDSLSCAELLRVALMDNVALKEEDLTIEQLIVADDEVVAVRDNDTDRPDAETSLECDVLPLMDNVGDIDKVTEVLDESENDLEISVLGDRDRVALHCQVTLTD